MYLSPHGGGCERGGVPFPPSKGEGVRGEEYPSLQARGGGGGRGGERGGVPFPSTKGYVHPRSQCIVDLNHY